MSRRGGGAAAPDRVALDKAAQLRAALRTGRDEAQGERERRAFETLQLRETEKAAEVERDRLARVQATRDAIASTVVPAPVVLPDVPDVAPLLDALSRALGVAQLAVAMRGRQEFDGAIAELRDVEGRSRAFCDGWPLTLAWSQVIDGRACVRSEYAAAQSIGHVASMAAHYIADLARHVGSM